jgi:hypothetical protein
VKPVVAVVAFAAFGWALVTAADARHDAKPPLYETVVVTQVQSEQSEWEQALDVETPLTDALVDWPEVERQTDCLWKLLEAHEIEITLEVVMAAGTWTDALGGACLVIGEDDGFRD